MKKDIIQTMKKITNTYHINVNKDEIAPTVLMVGDPARAKYFANKLLEDPKLVCNIRLINMWTGTYKGNLVTITSHGMGFPSIGIYAHELFNFFNVERIIRLGTCATYKKEINPGDIIIGNKYYTYSRFGEGYGVDPLKPSLANPNLFKTIENNFKKKNLNYHVGALYSSEWFYAPIFKNQGVKSNSPIEEKVASGEIIGQDMESYALQTIANYFNKEAITLVMVLTNLVLNTEEEKNNPATILPMGKNVLEALFD